MSRDTKQRTSSVYMIKLTVPTQVSDGLPSARETLYSAVGSPAYLLQCVPAAAVIGRAERGDMHKIM